VRPLRLTLAAGLAVLAATASPSSAAPPVGCYGVPSVPQAFVCVVSFTPGNALPGAGVPEVCAGDCYGPITLVPDDGSSTILVYSYQGQQHSVPGSGLPDLPVLPDVLPSFQDCPGTNQVGPGAARPFVCAYRETDWNGNTVIWVGTCGVDECTMFGIPAEEIGHWATAVKNDPKSLVCEARQTGPCG
jgi:hypothetical protein